MGEVLACVDLSDATEPVVEQAASIAKDRGDRLHVLHVAADEPVLAGYDKDEIATYKRSDRAAQLLDEHKGLRELAARLRTDGMEVIPLLEMGSTVEVILEVADRIDAETIVAGTHGHGRVHDALLGSVSHSLVKQTDRPVLL